MPNQRASKKIRQQRRTAGCMGIIAIVFLGVALGFTISTWLFEQRSRVIDAIVIDIERVGDDAYRPTFGFAGPDGPIEASPKVASGSYAYAIGDTVEIRYDPDDPTHALPTGTAAEYLIPIIAGSFGAIVLTLAVLTLASSMRAQRRTATPKTR
ncbi:MAG: DUF3592 domain-containing protein [Planctomycetota bacterium]